VAATWPGCAASQWADSEPVAEGPFALVATKTSPGGVHLAGALALPHLALQGEVGGFRREFRRKVPTEAAIGIGGSCTPPRKTGRFVTKPTIPIEVSP